jgi:hypothetical protein
VAILKRELLYVNVHTNKIIGVSLQTIRINNIKLPHELYLGIHITIKGGNIIGSQGIKYLIKTNMQQLKKLGIGKITFIQVDAA